MLLSRILVALVCAVISLSAAEQASVRIAVGPYFAPVQNAELQSTANSLPDLITAELAANARFQVVERSQVMAVINELHLSAEGLTSTDSTLKLGKLLSADWLISGSIAPSQTSTQIWTKVIDMRSGIVLELQATPLARDLMASVIEVGSFVSKVGRNNAGPRPYVALGPFRDSSMTPGRPDWSRELQSVMEKAFRERGFGVVERDAISVIAQEFDLTTSGLAAPSTNRVKLQPAFWLADGGSQWLEKSPTNFSITLRVQKVGAKETLLRITNAAGLAMLETIRSSLTRALQAETAAPVANAAGEGKVQSARGYELATARNPLADPNYLNTARGDVSAARRDNANMAVQRYEAAYALNPNDLESKHMLGYALCANPDTMERGKRLLWEIVKKNEPRSKQRALNAIAMADLSEFGPTPGSRMSFRPADYEQQMILLTNSTDLTAKSKLGTSLLGFPSERNQKRGVAYLEEVVRSGRSDIAPAAERALAEYRSRPPELRSRSLEGKVFAATTATPAPPKAAPFQPLISTRTEKPEETTQREFLQKNFNRFITVKLEKDGPQLARFHRLPVRENMFDYEGKHYCGFRFTVPPWIDGDLRWMHVLAKNEVQKNFSATGFKWYIIPRTGRMVGFSDFDRHEVEGYKYLRQRFPFTHGFFEQSLDRRALMPGDEYAIWFSFNEANIPDFEFAMTITSERGLEELGMLPKQ